MRREKIQNEYMFDTKVENIFINEYMISAPGNFVKVYLVALMYADLDKEIDDEMLAKTLSIEKDEVERAWKYWSELGVVKRYRGEIIFQQLKEGLYGMQQPEEVKEPPVNQNSLHVLDNNILKELFDEVSRILARPINGVETQAIIDWIDVFGATPEVIAFAYLYCVSRKKDNVKYIGKVVQSWTEKGFTTIPQVETYLQEIDQRHYVYKRVMKALGFTRNASEEERRIIDRWIDDFDFSMEMILDACKKTSGISNPNINYINTVLINRNKDKTGKDEKGKVTRKHVMEYYEYIREKAENDAKIRKEEIYSVIPRLGEIDDQIKANYVELTKLAISGGADKQSKLNQLKRYNESLNDEIKNLLTQAGVPSDYMDVHYKCPLCKDTGMLDDGRQCSCYLQRSEEAANWQKTPH